MNRNSNHLFSLRTLIAIIGVLALTLFTQMTVSHADTYSPHGASTLGDFVWHDSNVNGAKDEGPEWGSSGIDGVKINLYKDDMDGVFEPGSDDTFVNSLTTGDNGSTANTEHGWYDFTNITANGNAYWVEIDDSNFGSGGVLEGYVYTGNLDNTLSYSGEEPRFVYMNIPIMDYNDADFGYALPGIELVKTAGDAADGETEYIDSPQNVTFTYTYTNTGETHLKDITVVDDNGTPNDASDDFTVCTVSGPLAPGASGTCTASRMISTDRTNIAVVTANPTDGNGTDLPGDDVSDTDDATVDLVSPAIQLVKTADDAADGAVDYINSGNDVVYHYTVTNTGDTYLSNIVVEDDNGTPSDASDDFTVCTIAGPLAPNASQSCTHTVSNVTADVTNIATATGNPTDSSGNDLPDINDVTDDDDAVVQLFASLGDYVWEDADADGVQDAGESPISSVLVKLYKDVDGDGVAEPGGDDGSAVDTDQTDTNGAYGFDNLEPGDYFVEFTKPSGFDKASPSTPGAASDPTDSDADETTGLTNVTTLVSGENDPTWDAGFYKLASLGDYVWEDADADGVQDAGESPISSVLVKLYKDVDGDGVAEPGGDDGSAVDTDQTDTNGAYGFDNLEPGDYFVEFTKPSGFDKASPSTPGAASDPTDSDADETTGLTNVTTLVSGENDPTWDAGFYKLASLGDYVWFDLDEDGVQDAGEPGVESVLVTLKDANDATVDTTQTDDNGAYSFDGLAPGEYTVVFTLPGSDWSFSPKDNAGDDSKDSDANTTNGKADTVTLTSGENDSTIDAGMSIPSSYTITKQNTSVAHDLTPGDAISFTVTIKNTGKTWLAIVPLQDEYDNDYLTYVNANPASIDNNDDGVIDWSDLTVSFGQDLAPGDSFSVVVNFTAKAATNLLPNHVTINTATALDVVADPDGPNGPNDPIVSLDDQSDDATVNILNPVGLPIDAFSASSVNGFVQVNWRSESEANILGFNVLRKAKDGSFEQVNDSLIFARYAGADAGSSYHFIDQNVTDSLSTYRLEIVLVDNSIERYSTKLIGVRSPFLGD